MHYGLLLASDIGNPLLLLAMVLSVPNVQPCCLSDEEPSPVKLRFLGSGVEGLGLVFDRDLVLKLLFDCELNLDLVFDRDLDIVLECDLLLSLGNIDGRISEMHKN